VDYSWVGKDQGQCRCENFEDIILRMSGLRGFCGMGMGREPQTRDYWAVGDLQPLKLDAVATGLRADRCDRQDQGQAVARSTEVRSEGTNPRLSERGWTMNSGWNRNSCLLPDVQDGS